MTTQENILTTIFRCGSAEISYLINKLNEYEINFGDVWGKCVADIGEIGNLDISEVVWQVYHKIFLIKWDKALKKYEDEHWGTYGVSFEIKGDVNKFVDAHVIVLTNNMHPITRLGNTNAIDHELFPERFIEILQEEIA